MDSMQAKTRTRLSIVFLIYCFYLYSELNTHTRDKLWMEDMQGGDALIESLIIFLLHTLHTWNA